LILVAVYCSTRADVLLLVRLATGLGLGGAMPNFIALANEAVVPEKRLRVVTSIMATPPLGGALAGLIASAESIGFGWRVIFYIGGIAPLALALCTWLLLPEAVVDERSKVRMEAVSVAPPESVFATLFGGAQARTTTLLWITFFLTQLMLFLMLNWLPSLLVKSGFSGVQASWLSMYFNLGGSSVSTLLMWLEPFALVAGWAALSLCWRLQITDESSTAN
jgi:AAHS family 3-hydroxyphenylpropionic acid transporter